MSDIYSKVLKEKQLIGNLGNMKPLLKRKKKERGEGGKKTPIVTGLVKGRWKHDLLSE